MLCLPVKMTYITLIFDTTMVPYTEGKQSQSLMLPLTFCTVRVCCSFCAVMSLHQFQYF